MATATATTLTLIGYGALRLSRTTIATFALAGARVPCAGGRRWRSTAPFSCPSLLPIRIYGAAARAGGTGKHGRQYFSAGLAWRKTRGQDQDSRQQGDKESLLRSVLQRATTATARENIYTIPNLLTASRLVVAPFIGFCILHDHHACALGLFYYAAVTDLLDGCIARRWNLGTVVGTILDPMADKTLMTILVVSLATKDALPVWLAAIILGRDVGLAIAAVYYRWISLPPPKTFVRYWDFGLPSAKVRPTRISKYNTALQLGLMGLMMVAPLVPFEMGAVVAKMQYLVATTTVWSGASYIYTKDAVKILAQQENKQLSKGEGESLGVRHMKNKGCNPQSKEP